MYIELDKALSKVIVLISKLRSSTTTDNTGETTAHLNDLCSLLIEINKYFGTSYVKLGRHEEQATQPLKYILTELQSLAFQASHAFHNNREDLVQQLIAEITEHCSPYFVNCVDIKQLELIEHIDSYDKYIC